VGRATSRGKKVAGSTTGGTATLMADAALKHFGLESGRDVSVIPLRDNRLTALESGTVDAALLGVPENIIAVDKGYNELLFLGDVLSFPQNGFGALAKKIQENPDEVYRMVRATLRGFLFSLEPRNRDEVINIILRQWRLTDRRLAAEMLKQFGRGIMRDMSVRPEGIQLMIDPGTRGRKNRAALQCFANRRFQFSRQGAARARCGEIVTTRFAQGSLFRFELLNIRRGTLHPPNKNPLLHQTVSANQIFNNVMLSVSEASLFSHIRKTRFFGSPQNDI
jgi:hypothetical protein